MNKKLLLASKKLFQLTIFVLCIFVGIPSLVFSQTGNQSLFPTQSEDRPVPYTPEEFHPSLRFARRASIIAAGTFPFIFFGVTALYDLGRFAYLGISGNPQAPDYLPLFFAPPNKPANSQGENSFILFSSLGLSLVLGVIDGIIDQRNQTSRTRE